MKMRCKYNKKEESCNENNCRHFIEHSGKCVLVLIEENDYKEFTQKECAELLGYNSRQAFQYCEKKAAESFAKKWKKLKDE